MKNFNNKPKANAGEVTLGELRRTHGIDTSICTKWFNDAGLMPVREDGKSKFFYLKSAEEIIKLHKRHEREPDVNGEREEDSPFKEVARENAKRLRRENRISDKLESHDYMETSVVEKMMQMGIGIMEMLPAKIESRHGLAPAVMKDIQSMIDEARAAWSKGLKALQK